MKKNLKIVIGILIVIIVLGIIIFISSKFLTEKNNKISTNVSSENNSTETRRAVMVNGKLYYDTEKESTITGRCGNMDGQITSNVPSNQIPKEDNQANFEGEYNYQYGIENTIEIYIDNKWIVFQTETDF